MLSSWRAIAVPAAALLLWELAAHFRVVDLEFISRPSHILIAAIAGLADGSFLYATWQTLEACLFGLAIALVVGVSVGIVLGLSPFAEFMSRPSLESLRSIPSIAFAPLTLLLFGFGLPMEGMIVAYACLWPILITTLSAVRNIEPRLLEVAAALELSPVQRVQKIIVPAMLSRVLVGLRTAVGFALVVVGDGRDPDQPARARLRAHHRPAVAPHRRHVRLSALARGARPDRQRAGADSPTVRPRHDPRGAPKPRGGVPVHAAGARPLAGGGRERVRQPTVRRRAAGGVRA